MLQDSPVAVDALPDFWSGDLINHTIFDGDVTDPRGPRVRRRPLSSRGRRLSGIRTSRSVCLPLKNWARRSRRRSIASSWSWGLADDDAGGDGRGGGGGGVACCPAAWF